MYVNYFICFLFLLFLFYYYYLNFFLTSGCVSFGFSESMGSNVGSLILEYNSSLRIFQLLKQVSQLLKILNLFQKKIVTLQVRHWLEILNLFQNVFVTLQIRRRFLGSMMKIMKGKYMLICYLCSLTEKYTVREKCILC